MTDESISIEIFEFLSRAEDYLDQQEKKADIGSPYWLMEDAGESYCLDCILKQEGVTSKNDYGDTFDGGFCCEEDGCCTCEVCGKLLEYTLTDSGVDSELEHFGDYAFDWSSPNQCYELARISHGVFSDEQRYRLYDVMRRSVNMPEALLPFWAETQVTQ